MVSLSSPKQSRTLENIIMDINSIAVTLLCDGCEDYAMNLLHESIVLLDARARNMPEGNCTANRVTSRPTVLSPVDALDTFLGTEELPSKINESFLFHHNVMLVESDDDEDEDGIIDLEHLGDERRMMATASQLLWGISSAPSSGHQVWSMINLLALLLYNVAVINHAMGVTKGSLPQICQAHKLYNAALQNLLKSEQESSPAYIYLIAATFTNLGHASSLLHDITSMEICRQGLETILNLQVVHSSAATLFTPIITSCHIPQDHDAHETSSWSLFFRYSLNRVKAHENKIAPAA